MKSHEKMHHHSSGHSGHDSMREYADKMLGTSKASHVGSVRRFRDGGEVNHMDEPKMRHGGHHKEHHGAHHESHHRKHSKEGHPKYSVGGFFGDLMRSIPLVNMVTGPIADAAHLKKGGKVHSRKCKADGGEAKAEGGNMRHGGHHRKHRADGGEMMESEGGNMRRGGHHGKRKYGLGGMIAGAAGAPLLNKIPKVGKYMAQNLGMFGGLLPFAEGGEAKADGGCMRRVGRGRPRRRAEGGDMQDMREMHADGGAMRCGGHSKRKHRADGGSMGEPDLIMNAKKRWADNHPNGELYAEGGEAKKHGGSIKRKHKADGGATYTYQGRPYTLPEGWANPVKGIYAEGGEMKHGGPHRKHRADGGKAGEAPFCSTARKEGGHMHRARRAIGGAGKVRLGQSTPEGRPVGVRPARSR